MIQWIYEKIRIVNAYLI